VIARGASERTRRASGRAREGECRWPQQQLLGATRPERRTLERTHYQQGANSPYSLQRKAVELLPFAAYAPAVITFESSQGSTEVQREMIDNHDQKNEKISNKSSFGIIDIADSSTTDRIIVIVKMACFIDDGAYRWRSGRHVNLVSASH